jgi:Calcineurin-like phosphoesterase/Purple acid Phosphatase, N-terminal domain
MAPKRMTREVAKNLSIAEQHEWFQKQRSRRAVLKGGLVGGSVLGGTALFGPASLATAGVPGAATGTVPKPSPTLLSSIWPSNSSGIVPFGRHISYGGDPCRHMNIAWQVASPVANPFVRIGTNPFDLGEQIPAALKVVSTPWADITGFLDSVTPAATAAKAPEEQYYAHVAADTLAPGTTYYYSVGHQGLDPSGFALAQGPVSSFTTAPLWPGPFTFTAFGDQGTTYDAVSTTNLLLAQNPAFHLHAGDVSYAEDGGDGLLTDSYDPRAWDSYFVQAASTAAFIPWMVSLGNHEMEPWYSPDGYGADVSRFDFPGNGPAVCPGTYTFTYGNVGFISLDPNDVSYEIPANLGYSGGSQTAWLSQTLRSLRANRNIDFIVVFFHHCAYCTCTSHGSEGGVRQYWAPLFDQFGVDLVINGHNHIYERTDPIKAGAPTTTAPIGSTITPATQGTTYVAAGGAGKSLYAFSAPDSYEGAVDNVATVAGYSNQAGGTEVPETVAWSRVRYTGYGLLVVNVAAPVFGKATMVVRALNENGVELDNFTLSR